ncbi:MAG: secretin N-terminal domain-containing protein [Pirellulales bacterium]
MRRRSESLGARRCNASRRNVRARLALWCLLLLASFAVRIAAAQSAATLPAPDDPKPPDPAAAAAGEAEASEKVTAALDRRGDLNLHGLSLNNALFTIGEQWNVNIVAGDLQGTVNGAFVQAPLREILDSILLSNGYNYRAVGETLVVRSIESLGNLNPSLRSATIPVLMADIDEVVEGARVFLTPQGKLQAMKSARSIVVLDFPDRVKMIRDFVTTLEQAGERRMSMGGSQLGLPLEVAYFHTQHISAKTAEQALSAVLSKSGKVGVLEKEDRLVISDYAENLVMIEKVLAQIDLPRPQVRITALIYDISLQDIEQLGINWNHALKTRIDAAGDPGTSLGIDSVMQVPFQASAAGSTLTFMNLSRHLDITGVALALSNANDARLVANPNVTVEDNEDAIFQSVSEIPYQQLTQTSAGGQIGTTSFKEAGTTLRVRPKITSYGTIEMLVTPEFSRLTGFTPGDNQPIIDKRTATTMLRVANRQTLVIGGLRQRSDVGDFKGVPYLKDVPLLGRAFRSRDTNVRESELVVFVMPEIIGFDDPPGPRQQMVADTVNCRLDQIPLPEGCPPSCRRLPCDETMVLPAPAPSGEIVLPGPSVDQGAVAPAAAGVPLPPNGPVLQSLPPVVDGKVRRLPIVSPVAPAVVENAAAQRPGLFGAPPTAWPQGEYNARRPAAGVSLPR